MSTNGDTKDETSPLLGSATSGDTKDETTSPLLGNAGSLQAKVEGPDSLLDRGIRSLPPVRTYWWRWIVLLVFSLNLAMTNILWITAAPIANVVMCYYNVSEFWVNSLSEVYMLTYIILLFPAVWLLDKYGLRLSILLGACGDAAGAALKLAGTGPSYFWMTLLGQTVASLANVTVWTAAPLLSEVWFPAGERATATAIGAAIAPQMGILLGVGLTPFIFHTNEDLQFAVCGNTTVPRSPSPGQEDEWIDFMYTRMLYFNIAQAGLAMGVYILTLIAFPNAPPTPPSISRQLESEHEKGSGYEQFKEFVLSTLGAFKNFYFVLYLLVTAILIAIGGAVTSVVNQIVHPYFPDYDEDIGYLGITTQVSSLVAMLIAGRVLDWTKAYYIVNLTVCFLSVVCIVLWATLIQFQTNFYMLYIPAVFTGVSMASFQAVAYEYAIEMTYPLAEGTSSGLVNLGSQVLSIVVISFVGHYSSTDQVPVGLWFMVGVTALGFVIALFVRPELRRVKIDSGSNKKK